MDFAGKGSAILFDPTNDHAKLHQWSHSKTVWTVRISPLSAYLAVGGYDMALSLYCTSSYQLLRKITYEPKGGPAFIWSLEWSGDGQRLAVGCWNTHVYLYHVTERAGAKSGVAVNCPGAQATKSDEAMGDKCPILLPLTEICRTDRAYAVDLDARGEYVVVGGRDKVRPRRPGPVAVPVAKSRSTPRPLASSLTRRLPPRAKDGRDV